MKVKLRKPWYHEGVYYRAEFNGVEVPDDLKDQLPPHSAILDGVDAKPKAAAKAVLPKVEPKKDTVNTGKSPIPVPPKVEKNADANAVDAMLKGDKPN